MQVLHPSRYWRITVLVACTLTGCVNSGEIVVTDIAGKPIPNASVTLVSDSFNSKPQLTDQNGKARFAMDINWRWIDVTKERYQRAYLDVPSRWPVYVQLRSAEKTYIPTDELRLP